MTQQESRTVQEMVNPFSQEDLVHYWDAYAASGMIDKKVYLKNTMINCKRIISLKWVFIIRASRMS